MAQEIELERTFLVKRLPEGLQKCPSEEIADIYIPRSYNNAQLRLRRKGDALQITKKEPVTNDASIQTEDTIILTAQEFEALSKVEGKPVRKLRYKYQLDSKEIEIDVFQDQLTGLVLVDVEFKSEAEKESFKLPDFCLADVTQEEFIAGGYLAGKSYQDIEKYLDKYKYNKIN